MLKLEKFQLEYQKEATTECYFVLVSYFAEIVSVNCTRDGAKKFHNESLLSSSEHGDPTIPDSLIH